MSDVWTDEKDLSTSEQILNYAWNGKRNGKPLFTSSATTAMMESLS